MQDHGSVVLHVRQPLPSPGIQHPTVEDSMASSCSDIRLVITVTALLLVASPAHPQDWEAVQIQVVPVADGIYMLVGAGGNIGLSVGEDGAFVIDDQFAPLTDKIKAAIATVTDQPVEFVVNTHWHGDHTGGNENFGEAGAMIVAHENVRRRMNPEELGDLVGTSQQAPDSALPVVTFTDKVTFHWNGQTIHVQHVGPPHTDGDSVIWFEEASVVHMGDNFFVGRYPFIDVDSGGNVQGMIGVAEMVLEHVPAGTQLIPGHGPLSQLEDLQAFHDFLVGVRDTMQELIDRGMSLEEAIEARPYAETDDAMSSSFVTPERFITIVYRSLTGQ